MSELLVRGLDGEGPGDVVGAFVNEAGADPDAIGEITVDGDTATVEYDGDAARVAAAMDGGDVGRSTVSVAVVDGAVAEYVAEQRRLVECEREAEMERHETEIRRLSGREREAKGRALVGMRGRDEGEGLGGHLVKFLKEGGDELPDHELGVGDLVMVSKRDPLREDNPTGTVAEVTNHSVTVAFDGEPQGFVFGDSLRLDLYVNDVTFQRMHDALDRLRDADGRLAELRDVLAGVAEASEPAPVEVDEWFDDGLNDAQRTAVERALGAEDVHLIHGPPGTGKTTTAVEVIRQAVARGESVLATAASNTAVDNVAEFLAARGVDVVRVGHPARVTPTLREHTLDSRVEDREAYQRSRELRDEAFDLLDEQDDLTPPSGRWRRGLSDDRIRELADEGRGARGVPPERIAEMAEYLDLQSEIEALFADADRLEAEATAAVLDDADVVCATNATAGSDLLDGREFDLLVVDEATQATEPSTLIPLVRADRAVLAGDHRQLPPTVQSEAAADAGLRETLFERLADRGAPRDLLDVQYRMHEDVMDYASREFYDGRLRAAERVADHTLADRGVRRTDLAHPEVLDPEVPATFVDTAGVDAPERQRDGSHSRENPTEAALVAAYVADVVEAGLDPADVAVVSPYDDQVRRLRERVPDGVEVDTVDGFQGREKDAVFASLVRSNDRGDVGFLDEQRRFNVAATRARRKLVVVGDASTVAEVPALRSFVEHARERGRVVVPDEAGAPSARA